MVRKGNNDQEMITALTACSFNTVTIHTFFTKGYRVRKKVQIRRPQAASMAAARFFQSFFML